MKTKKHISNRKIYNNKGKVVEQYEPFFDSGFDYVLPQLSATGGIKAPQLGVKIKMYYDPLGRLVVTKNPNGSEQWAMYGTPNNLLTPAKPTLSTASNSLIPSPWVNFVYDVNDLANIVSVPNANVPSTHFGTPKSSEIDALGRTVKTVEYFDNSNYANTITMQYNYDIRGNLVLIKDPYNKTVFKHIYDLRPAQKDNPLPPVWTEHIDKGINFTTFDVLGKPVQSDDAKEARILNAYDRLQRPIYNWARNKSSETITLRNHTIYGDNAGLINPENENLNKQIYKHYDEAGLVEISEYDFKGNVLSKKRQVIDSSVLKTKLDNYETFIVDWTGLPSILASFIFQTDMAYDALNRIVTITLPEDLEGERKKINPAYNRAGTLEKVDLYSPTGGTTNYVENIAYNAKGQRLLIAFGNDIMTRYVYDNRTFRLMRQRSEKYAKSQTGNTITYTPQSGTNKQDDGFNFDLVGNILKILHRVNDCGINGSLLGSDALDQNFEYDSIYRLTYADGRESDTQSGNNYLYNDAPTPGMPNANNVRSYNRAYSYDKLGNVQSVIQSGTNGFTRNYAYNNGKNTLQKIENSTPITLESYLYDNCGNTLNTNLNRHYIWNHTDQLICYKNQIGASNPTIYTQYDYSGQERVSKLVRTGTDVAPIYERVIYIDGIFEYHILEDGTTYEKNYIQIMDDKSRIAEIRIGDVFPDDIADSITYNLEDQIGSSCVRLNTSGTVIDKEEYYPFGDSSLRTFTKKRYRYVGKEKDLESGLYYYGARYYAAWTCRFISIDPLAHDYMHLTPYNYAGNKPINSVDIDGMQGENETKSGGGNTEYSTPEGVPPNANIGDIFKDSKGNEWIFDQYENTPGGQWGQLITGVKIKDTKSKEVNSFLKFIGVGYTTEGNSTSKNAYPSLKGVTMDNFFGKAPSIGSEGKGAYYTNKKSPYYGDWMKARANHQALESFMTGYMIGSFTAPFAVGSAPAIFGISSDLTIKSIALKTATSATVQAIVNDGKINVVGAIADGTLGFGSSSIIGSGIEYNYNLFGGSTSFDYLGNGISGEQFFFNSSVNILFGAKSEFLGNQMKAAGINSGLSDGIANPLYQFSSNGLSKAYENRNR